MGGLIVNQSKIKLFSSLSFFDFLEKKETFSILDRIENDLFIKRVSTYGDCTNTDIELSLQEKNIEININGLIINTNNIIQYSKFSLVFMSCIAYPTKYLKEKTLHLLDTLPDLKSHLTHPIEFDQISSSLIGDIFRDVLEPCFFDEWLYLNEENFLKINAQMPIVLDRLSMASFILTNEQNNNTNVFYEKLIASLNYQNTAKGGLVASANRKEKEKAMKEKAVISFTSNDPRTNKRWRSRNEFYDYFVTVTNKNICNEDEWLKTSTVKRWITEYLKRK